MNDSAYTDDILRWRQNAEDTLRSETGWLTLTGLYWLETGANSVGAAPDSDVILPPGSVDRLGVIDFQDGVATLRVEADVQVTVDGVATREAVLRDSNAPEGPSIVQIGAASFFVLQRNDLFGVRMRDANNPARLEFPGRRWFPIDPSAVVEGTYIPNETPQMVEIENSIGQTITVGSPGRVEFTYGGQALSLVAFEASEGEVWFVMRDATSGVSTYKAARFLYAPLAADNTVILDFNKAYHPPCAFTSFATCPLPPRQNVLPVAIEAGERL